jgi:hypothetical protein
VKDEDIKTGVKIENIHHETEGGHRYEVGFVGGIEDHAIVFVEMIGLNGRCSLMRDRKTVRDHYRVVG